MGISDKKECSLYGVIVGAILSILSVAWTNHFQAKQKEIEFSQKRIEFLMDKRAEIIKDMSGILSYAVQIEGENHPEKKMLEKNVEYQTVRNMALIYFCNGTKNLLNKTPFGKKEDENENGDWWNVSTEQINRLLKMMLDEYKCDNL